MNKNDEKRKKRRERGKKRLSLARFAKEVRGEGAIYKALRSVRLCNFELGKLEVRYVSSSLIAQRRFTHNSS